MKKFKLSCSLVALAASVLLTSCLGDSGNSTQSAETQFAVARTDSKVMKTVLDVYYYGALYSPSIELMVNPGDCYFIDYQIDFSSPENVNVATNGYYVASIGKLTEIDKAFPIMQVTDTTALLENEQPVEKLAIGTYVSGNFLLGMNFAQLKNQQTRWEVYYDPSQEGGETTSGERYYDLFVRAVKKVDGEGSSSTAVVYRSVQLKNFIEQCIEKEKANSKKTVNFNFNYLKSFNAKDSTDLKWEIVSVPFAVSATGN